MLIVGVFHGLGNQMFQYAFYLSLKLKGYDVYLDNKLEWLGYKKAHNGYELDKVFNINNVFISEEKRKYYKGWSGILGKIQRKLIKNDKLYIKRSPIEDNIKYYPEVFNFNNKLLISGWQSEKYFYDIKKDIKNAFCFKQTLDDKNLKLAKEMKKENSISVHIRRGDYLKDKYFYGVCDKNYYDKAIKYFLSKNEKSKVYFFSNDMDWCRKNFCDERFYFVEGNVGTNSYKDMQLMSCCKHNIIANSTFSWWGAWLNNNKNKIVIAPNKWFNSVEGTCDIIPETWKKFDIF